MCVGCRLYTHWQKRQYMTPWDENALVILVIKDEFNGLTKQGDFKDDLGTFQQENSFLTI